MATETSPTTPTVQGSHLARLAQACHEARGDYPSLFFEGRWHDSGELFDRSQRLAGGLIERGIAPGDRVVVTMANGPEVGIAYQALWRAGAVVTPATFLLPATELRHVIADSEATAVITTPELLAKAREACAGLNPAPQLICAGDAVAGDAGTRDAVVELDELERAAPAPIVERADDDLAALLYTGGTTGRAKGVMLSHANLHYTGAAAHAAAYVPGVNRALTCLPLSHAYGLLVTVTALHSPERGVTILQRWFDAAGYPALVAEHGVQLSAVVPTMLSLLLGQPLEDHDLSSLRFLTSGGAPLAPEVERAFRQRVPGVSIRQGYGMTETAALISTNPVGRERPGTVGLPVPGTELEIRNDTGHPLSPGEVGEICVRSPGVMRGYWRSPEATAEAIGDGWLHTGDLGYLDEEGYLHIADRKKDLIIRGGFNVYPRDIEDALLRHPAVSMAGVIGRPSERHGEEVVAFVSLTGGRTPTEAQLVSWARETIGGYRYPREIHIVDAVPLTAVGKIDRKALRGQLGDPALRGQLGRPALRGVS